MEINLQFGVLLFSGPDLLFEFSIECKISALIVLLLVNSKYTYKVYPYGADVAF